MSDAPFWDDLNADLRDPEYRIEHVRAVRLLATSCATEGCNLSAIACAATRDLNRQPCCDTCDHPAED